jgi:hypothetical protein
MMYKKNTITTRSEWKELLTNAYIWYDWFSQPQPSRGTSQDEITRLKRDLILALDSVSAYVERTDTLMILAPSSVHADMVDEQTGRKTYTCYRTWRRRGFCVLEFFCANFSRRSTHPVLLVRSEMDAPIWISPQETLKLAVGECNFTCCETNHLGPKKNSKMECSRPNVRIVLDRMIHAKASYLFMMNNIMLGRWTRVLGHWWLRSLDKKKSCESSSCYFSASQDNLKIDLKRWLEWDDKIDGTFYDRHGVSLLIYSVCANHLNTTTYILNEINTNFKDHDHERRRHIESRIPEEGFVHVGIQGLCTAMHVAMAVASPAIVNLLLENGCDVYATEATGSNPFACACAFNRVENVKFWLKQLPNWNLEIRNTMDGGVALACAVFLGPNRLRLLQILKESGASVTKLEHIGGSILTAACASDDSDPNVVAYLLQNGARALLNYRMKAQTITWKLIVGAAKLLTRFNVVQSGAIKFVASEAGNSALHFAALSGDVEIVELLLSEGADPSLKNDLGQDAAAMCTSFPELRGMLQKRERKMKLRGVVKKKNAVEVLGKRISTATPIQHEMWLISLETLLMLYVYSCRFLSHSYISYTHAHTGTEREARVVSWKSIRS